VSSPATTVLVFGDQLNTSIGALAQANPEIHRVLMIESFDKISSRKWHIQRIHLIVAAMRRFAEELQGRGYSVDYRRATSFRDGIDAHRAEFRPTRVIATEPNSWSARQLLDQLGVEQVRSNQFLCHPDDFESFVAGRKSYKMEDFYRWQRVRLGYLVDGDKPVGGTWNLDKENREPPPRDGSVTWPQPSSTPLDDLDREIIDAYRPSSWGDEPTGAWATTRADALQRLAHFIDRVLPGFGPHEDAMLADNWHLAHSLLSPYLNLGLLLPTEVCDAAHEAYLAGKVPLNSAEGFIRQIIGWREFIWNTYWKWMPDYPDLNALHATTPLPPVFTDPSRTKMNCLSQCVSGVKARGYAHHIQRLMVMGNFALIAGINPRQFTDWMWESFVDAAEWVMVPNVVGMTLYADGGRVATKPYAAGGNYIDKMSDYCASCSYDRAKRVGDDACPFTTLYWNFLSRNEERLLRNPRVAQQVRAAQRLGNIDAVNDRAADVLGGLDAGRF
jgi:deoxyribodipyrimidine photolyase-related protein